MEANPNVRIKFIDHLPRAGVREYYQDWLSEFIRPLSSGATVNVVAKRFGGQFFLSLVVAAGGRMFSTECTILISELKGGRRDWQKGKLNEMLQDLGKRISLPEVNL